MALIQPTSYLVAKKLLECFCAELAANANEDATLKMPGRCCLRAGVDVPLDVNVDGFVVTDMCCIGEAYVKVISVYPSLTFPEPDAAPLSTSGCQMTRLTVALEMGTIRCINDDKDCAENDLKLRWMLADAQASFNAACCWGKALQDPAVVGRGTRWFAGAWEQAGPDGDCLTGTMQLFASIPGPGCC